MLQLETDSRQQFLSSPNYPNKYISDADCIWYIRSPFINGSIVINVLELDTENFYDYVSIGYGGNASFDAAAHGNGNVSREPQITAVMSGNQAPNKLIFKKEPVIWVRFISDGGYVKRGFLFELKLADVNGKFQCLLVVVVVFPIRYCGRMRGCRNEQ